MNKDKLLRRDPAVYVSDNFVTKKEILKFITMIYFQIILRALE